MVCRVQQSSKKFGKNGKPARRRKIINAKRTKNDNALPLAVPLSTANLPTRPKLPRDRLMLLGFVLTYPRLDTPPPTAARSPLNIRVESTRCTHRVMVKSIPPIPIRRMDKGNKCTLRSKFPCHGRGSIWLTSADPNRFHVL